MHARTARRHPRPRCSDSIEPALPVIAQLPPSVSLPVLLMEFVPVSAPPRMNYSMLPVKDSPPKSRTRHFEHWHESNRWRLDMRDEVALGVVPSEWSVSSAMNDPRPNGKSIFDARFIQNPVGRARAGRSMTWDPRARRSVASNRPGQSPSMRAHHADGLHVVFGHGQVAP